MALRISGDLRGKRILNIGCWIGWFEKFAVEQDGASVVGVDTNEEFLEKARRFVGKAKFVHASASNLPFQNGFFDIVTMFDVLEHTPRSTESKCLTETNRVLRPGGTLILSVPASHVITNILDPAWYLGHRHYKASQVTQLLQSNGFSIKQTEYGGGFVELISMIFLYVFKLFGLEIPLKKVSDRLRDREYSLESNGAKFATLFVRAEKLEEDKRC